MGDKPFLALVVPLVPAFGWIRAYKAKQFPRDLVAGLSLAAFVIPESPAYASPARLPPVTGLYCYLVAGITYAVFGTSRQLAVGPTSALAITVATSVVAIGDGDLSRAVTLASALALIVGVVCIAGRFVGLANVAYFISDAILVGFKTGAALYIASTQLPKLFTSLVPAVDVSAGGVLRGLARSLKARNIAIVVAGLRDDVRENLTAVGAEQDLGPIPAHRTIEDCLRDEAGSILMKGPG